MLQSPNFVVSRAAEGVRVPTYAYANNNPVKYTDPTGLYSWILECDPCWVTPAVQFQGHASGGICDDADEAPLWALLKCDEEPEQCACAHRLAKIIEDAAEAAGCNLKNVPPKKPAPPWPLRPLPPKKPKDRLACYGE